MKLIHIYAPPTNLKIYTLDSSDVDEFKKLGLSNEVITRLQNYLNSTGIEVKIQECYDGQSLWRGFEFWINNKDLSVNGFCFSEERLILYLESVGY